MLLYIYVKYLFIQNIPDNLKNGRINRLPQRGGEKFCDGFWSSAVEDKVFYKILVRLAELEA